MKRTKHIELKIAEPCHEDWDKMSISEQGRFCGSCRKEVVSFADKSEAQIVAYFKRAPKNVCGQFRSDQLRSYLLPKEPQRISSMGAMAVGSLFALLSVNTAYAQIEEVEMHQQFEEPVIPDCPTPWEGMDEEADSLHAVTGTITDMGSDMPIADALVLDKKHGLSVRTDEHGRFMLTVPERFRTTPFSISIQAEGFIAQERLVIPDQLPVQFSVALRKGPTRIEDMMLGEVEMIKGKVAAPRK